MGAKKKQITYEIDENGCHNCTSHSKNKLGYCRLHYDYKGIPLHRYMYELKFGKLEDSKLIMRHKCDNPSCINPDHLEPGTQGDNNRDRAVRGRSRYSKGESSPVSKITEEIAKELFTSEKSPIELSKIYNIDDNHIRAIKRGVYWSHVTEGLINRYEYSTRGKKGRRSK